MNPIIRVSNLTKEFQVNQTTLKALDDINFEVEEGDIYGIIGMSGAGKSTLVRCFNHLEKPSRGDVYVKNKNLSIMSKRELRNTRKDIAMIFQHFNLLMQKTVLENICFPLKIAGVKKRDAIKRGEELLEIVGLSEKAKAYPSQLSGGQKQRVAIARALANNPNILLCDEATSALDPQTTTSILELLKEINQKYGITIIIITHEMAVVQKICSHVAILDRGHLAETGTVLNVFTHPKSEAAKKLVFGREEKISFLDDNRCIRIVFNGRSSYDSVISDMVLHFQTPVNIIYANTRNIEGTAQGEMIIQLPKEKEISYRMIAYLKEKKLSLEEDVKEIFDKHK